MEDRAAKIASETTIMKGGLSSTPHFGRVGALRYVTVEPDGLERGKLASRSNRASQLFSFDAGAEKNEPTNATKEREPAERPNVN